MFERPDFTISVTFCITLLSNIPLWYPPANHLLRSSGSNTSMNLISDVLRSSRAVGWVINFATSFYKLIDSSSVVPSKCLIISTSKVIQACIGQKSSLCSGLEKLSCLFHNLPQAVLLGKLMHQLVRYTPQPGHTEIKLEWGRQDHLALQNR